MLTTGDDQFVRACERGDIAPGSFTHAAHLRLALAYLADSASLDEAADRMARTLRRFAAAAGHPAKYHHTITIFWMRMMARLLDKNLLRTYYSPQRLSSDAARTSWLEPDLQALDGASTNTTDPSRDASHRAVSR